MVANKFLKLICYYSVYQMPIELLIVEDEEYHQDAFLSFYHNDIEEEKYKIIFANTGEEAIEIIENDKNRQINFIICDLKMPAAKIDGWGFIKYLASNSIHIKTLIVSVVGKLEDFNEQERKNIVSFIRRNTPEYDLSTIKNQIELCVNYPDRFTTESQKVRFDTLLKSAKDLPSKQKIKFIEKLLSFSDLKELRRFQTELPQLIEQNIDGAIERDRIRQWLREKEKNGQIEFTISTNEGTRQKIPVRDLNYFYIDRKNRHNSIYCEIRWWWEGSLRYTNVPKHLLDELLPLLISTSR